MNINALPLDGWDETSTWGFEEGSFYAQLTPNGISDDDGPQAWIAPPEYFVYNQQDLARAIAAISGASVEDVTLALRLSAGPGSHSD